MTRSHVQRLLKAGSIKCDDKDSLKPSKKVPEGRRFTADIPESLNLTYLKADPVEFEVVYEDEYIFVINKPSGLVVHPAPGSWRNTLVNGLVYRYPEMRELPNWLRPGIVHRLDGGTSGLMVVARTQKVTLALINMFKERTVHKHYIALAHGVPEKREGILSGPIARDPANPLRMMVAEGGKPSLTGYKVLWSIDGISLAECELFTGRTHQIRVHMSALGCPLVGDKLYGANDEGLRRVYLHSWKLEFSHPVTGEAMKFRQPLTPDFLERIRFLREGKPINYTENETSDIVEANEDFDIDGDFD
ncbi:MAG: RluA family pseudouridine synthase [Synergistaceae bacterium]|nr:RluA family pseudouridine synthase [Synergistaceae bacterium]